MEPGRGGEALSLWNPPPLLASPPPKGSMGAERKHVRNSVPQRLVLDRRPPAVLHHAQERFVRSLMLGGAEAYGGGTKRVVVILDAFQACDEAVSGEVFPGILQRQGDDL